MPWGVRGPVDFWALRRFDSARLAEGLRWLSRGIALSLMGIGNKRTVTSGEWPVTSTSHPKEANNPSPPASPYPLPSERAVINCGLAVNPNVEARVAWRLTVGQTPRSQSKIQIPACPSLTNSLPEKDIAARSAPWQSGFFCSHTSIYYQYINVKLKDREWRLCFRG